VTYIASTLARIGDGWEGADLDLSDVQDLDELADRLRESGSPSLLFLEEDDEYLAIVRVDGDAEPRVFVSDGRVLVGDGVAGRLLADSIEPVEPEPVDEDEDDEDSGRPEVEPAGDDAVLADLGVGAEQLVALCAEERMLPSDVIFALAEALGAADVLEEVRGI
jgi:putative tRNA adenosine deaminase-associated protein